MNNLRKASFTQSRGFTIVELLIVIVIIAILAAITIVSYSGIQNMAKDAQMISAVNEYVKGLKSYQAINDTIPYYGDIACFDGTMCWSGASTSAAASMRNELKTVMGASLPTIPTPYAALLANSTTSDVPNGGNYTGFYVLYQHSLSSSSCQPIGGTRYLNSSISGDMRTCRAAIE